MKKNESPSKGTKIDVLDNVNYKLGSPKFECSQEIRLEKGKSIVEQKTSRKRLLWSISQTTTKQKLKIILDFVTRFYKNFVVITKKGPEGKKLNK